MDGHSDIVKPIEVVAITSRTFRQRVSPICFFIAITVAMIGWCSAFGWVAVTIANWLWA
jgi:hypothetical protein